MSFHKPIWHNKKSVKLAIASSTLWGCRIALEFRTDNAKPTPNIKYTLVLDFIKVRVRACAHTQKTYHHWHKRDNLISRRTSIVAKSWNSLKLATFHNVRTERNKRLFNMSANPSESTCRSPAWIHGAKVVKKLQMCKRTAQKSAFFSLENAAKPLLFRD